MLFNPLLRENKLFHKPAINLSKYSREKHLAKFSISIPEEFRSLLPFNKSKRIIQFLDCEIIPAIENWPRNLEQLTLKELLALPYYSVKEPIIKQNGQYSEGCILTEGDVIKIGKEVYLVQEIHLPSNRRNSARSNRKENDMEVPFTNEEIYVQKKNL